MEYVNLAQYAGLPDGEIIKRIRKWRGLTQKELADKCGISEMSIRRYESGDRAVNFKKWMMICNALDVSLIELIDETGMDLDYNKFDIIEWSGNGHVTTAFSDDLRKALTDEELMENRILESFRKLNFDGQQRAIALVDDLAKVPDYQKPTNDA